MSSKTTVNRAALLSAVNLIKPALASQAYIPALTHICFAGDMATAYNDVSAISVQCETEVQTCLPGDLLTRALNSFSAESVVFQADPKESSVVLASGRSKLKMPCLPVSGFPMEWPDLANEDSIQLDASVLKGIERCLLSIGNDPTHPAQMGVTLDQDDKKKAVLYSTDNFSISRYQTTTAIDLPGESPVILPAFFCNQLVSLSKAFPDVAPELFLVAGALVATFGKKATLFTKTLLDLEPLDYPHIVEKHCKLRSIKDQLVPIPDSWDAAFGRAMLVLAGEVDKVTKVTITEDYVKLKSSSTMGDSDESISFDADLDGMPAEPVHVDPSLVIRASKSCGHLTFTDKVLILADQDVKFLHLIAYCSK